MSLAVAESLADYLNLVADHECGIEANAELTDDVNVLFLLVIIFKIERTALCDSAEVLLELLAVHTDTVIGNREGSCLLIGLNFDCEVTSVESEVIL